MNAHDGSVVSGFVIARDARDARDALVHVRDVRTGECVGCIELGLYEIVRALIVEEVATPARRGRQEREG